MKVFLRSAEFDEITACCMFGFIDDATTNPSLIAKSSQNIHDRVTGICKIVHGPVSAEVTATDYHKMLAEGRKLAAIALNVAVKIPLNEAGVQHCRTLSHAQTKINATMYFTTSQALLAAKAGPMLVLPFVGQIDNIGRDGIGLIQKICTLYANYDYPSKILVASVRRTQHVDKATLMGANVVTLPLKILTALNHHPLTDSGQNAFNARLGKNRAVKLVA